jgi:hypothetical protein
MRAENTRRRRRAQGRVLTVGEQLKQALEKALDPKRQPKPEPDPPAEWFLAVQRVGRALYPKDWIGHLTPREAWMLQRYPQPFVTRTSPHLPGGISVLTVAPWPDLSVSLREELDRVRDRRDWMNEQYETAGQWLEDRGLDPRHFDQGRFARALHDDPHKPKIPGQKRGPKSKIAKRVIGEMVNGLKDKRWAIDEFKSEKQIVLGERHHCHHRTADKCRKIALEEWDALSRIELVTNPDSK